MTKKRWYCCLSSR